jgi:hypothetical protein
MYCGYETRYRDTLFCTILLLPFQLCFILNSVISFYLSTVSFYINTATNFG